MHFENAVPCPLHMSTTTGRKGYDAILEDKDIQRRRDRNTRALLFDFASDKSLERDQVVVFEYVDLLSWFADDDILHGEGMDGQRLGNGIDVFLCGIADIDPPDWEVRVWSAFMLFEDNVVGVSARE